MNDFAALQAAEAELLGELLERERGELTAQIHHARTTEMRERLHERLKMVQDLQQRMQAASDVDVA
ncbi:MAG: hypothetical protein ACOY3P_15555 [Planctomycetota bacterium]